MIQGLVAADFSSGKDQTGYPETLTASKMKNAEEYVSDSSSLLSLQPWIFKKEKWENLEGNEDDFHTFGYGLDRLGNGFETEFSSRSRGTIRSQSSFRSRRTRRYYVKPFTSIENSLIPQLYKDVEVEECIFSSPPPSVTPTLRPFCITDGSRIISKSSSNSSSMTLDNLLNKEVHDLNYNNDEFTSGEMDKDVRFPRLPEQTKQKRKSRRVQDARLAVPNLQQSQEQSHLLGSFDKILLFCLGINVGVMFTAITNRKEVEKLNGMLKQSENLVQDLQEELEMKDSFTVRELDNETTENQEPKLISTSDVSIALIQNQARTSHEPSNVTEEHDQQQLSDPASDPEALSKIEAELEAELERLEQSIHASSLKQRMNALAELDPDLVVDVVHGELKANKFDSESLDEAKGDTNSTSTSGTPDVNYAVSPTELSLRLHELVEARLHERIEVLERALSLNQKKVHLMEAERVSTGIDLSISDPGSSSNQESPRMAETETALDHPCCINLTGDAVGAYDEAYEEFMRMTETMQQSTPSSTNTGEQVGECYSFDRSLVWGLEDGNVDESSAGFDDEACEMEQTWKQISRGKEYGDEIIADLGSEEDDVEDEEGKELIQKIVEKTRKGSPVLRNAQMMLFSLDH
ncbi:hypothetical protein J5N97_010222 [Dioscorea zingiberensis]|uniref:Pericentriolar material 1 protein n=1 Tax=Dioscorea zingiberensis TaxID=325984 RepID=A0A9D5CZS1_9LILI|nr:hypothetical protein J5N97_010222 [Dioscorea zingiberensis]